MMHDGTEHACHRDESWHDSISNNRPPSDFLPSFFDSIHYTGNTMASSAVHTRWNLEPTFAWDVHRYYPLDVVILTR